MHKTIVTMKSKFKKYFEIRLLEYVDTRNFVQFEFGLKI